jgi:DNA-binding IclR family transcriptional regulator
MQHSSEEGTVGRRSLYDVRKDSVLTAVKRLTDQKGSPPSLRDVAEVTGISVSTLHNYLPQMAEEGLVTWQPKSHRTIRLTTAALETF